MCFRTNNTQFGFYGGRREGIIKDFIAFPVCLLSATGVMLNQLGGTCTYDTCFFVETAVLYRQGLSMIREPEGRA